MGQPADGTTYPDRRGNHLHAKGGVTMPKAYEHKKVRIG